MSQRQTHKQTELIVFGFMKDAQHLLQSQTSVYCNIPTDIARVTLLYLDNYFNNDGMYRWKIRDKQMVDAMLNANCGDKFVSDPFKMVRLNWRLEIYPNGIDMDTTGYFVIHLRLLSLPSTVGKVELHRIFRVIENMAASPCIANVCCGEYEYWTKKCPLKELIHLKCKTITVEVQVQINKLILKQSISYIPNVAEYIDDFAMKQQLIYKVEGETLNIFKNSMNHKDLCGDIINNMWCFSISPNGMAQADKGYIDPFIGLCRLPPNTINIRVKYKIICIETGHEFEQECNLNAEQSGYGPMYFMQLTDIKHLNCITFIADIEIIDMEKKINNLEIYHQSQITYLLS